MNISSFIRHERNLSRRKRPERFPLLVGTGLYYSLITMSEILGVAVKAPFGSGKTVGLGLRAYHDARLGSGILADWHVIMLSTRELITRDELFTAFVKGNRERVMCGSLVTLAAWYVWKRYDVCEREGDTRCYTTLSRREAKAIGKILDGSEEGRLLLRRPSLAEMSKVLPEIEKAVGRKLLVIIDEIEGFTSEIVPGVTTGDIVYSNLAVMGALHDRGVFSARLFILGQSKVLDREWDELVNSVNEGTPYYSSSLRALLRTPKGSLYHCKMQSQEKINVSALSGRVVLKPMRYYPGNVYTEYIRQALERLETYNGIKEETLRLVNRYSKQLNDYITKKEVSEHLSFLGAVAPRIAFDIVDEIVAGMIASREENIVEAVKRALRRVADLWQTSQGVYSYYSTLIISRLAGRGRITVYGLASKKDYPHIIENLVRDVYSQVFVGCRFSPISGRYHSNHIGVATCIRGSEAYAGILVLRATTGKPTRAKFKDNLKKHTERLISASLEIAASSLNQKQRKNLTIRLRGVMLVPEATPELAVATLNQLFQRALSEVRISVPPLNRVPSLLEKPAKVRKIDDEDFIIIAARNLSPGQESDILRQFVIERYMDIVAEIAKTVA